MKRSARAVCPVARVRVKARGRALDPATSLERRGHPEPGLCATALEGAGVQWEQNRPWCRSTESWMEGERCKHREATAGNRR